jgi:hypothetical protein
MTTEEETHVEDWIVEEPVDGIVLVKYKPNGQTYEITVAEVRGAKPGENEVWKGRLDDYLRKRAINIAAHRMLSKRGD